MNKLQEDQLEKYFFLKSNFFFLLFVQLYKSITPVLW